MGMLVGMRYPTRLALGAADHTYVKCASDGRAWGCWGGKSGGTELRRAPGSTRRADRIAEPDERAGVTCYLVNGVCHQSANRILYPASATVRGARGYGLSVARFGAYGRPTGLFGMCPAPFHQHANVQGDLPECVLPAATAVSEEETGEADGDRARELIYLERVTAAYLQAETGVPAMQDERPDPTGLMVDLFSYWVDFALGSEVEQAARLQLAQAHLETERAQIDLEDAYARKALAPGAFPAESEYLTRNFQEQVMDILDDVQYLALFGSERGKPIALADPDIASEAYPEG